MELNVHSTLYLTLQMATLIRCSLSEILRPLVPFVHDTASKFHPDQRLPVLHRVIAIVGRQAYLVGGWLSPAMSRDV